MLPQGVDEAAALVITDRQKAGLQPPTYAFAPTQKKSSPRRFGTFWFDASVEHQLSSELERQTNSTRKDKQNAIHGHRQNHERLRKRRRTPRSPANGRHEQIQRRALRSRSLVRLRRSSPLLQRRPRPLLRQETHRH